MRLGGVAVLIFVVVIPTVGAATPTDPPRQSLYAFTIGSKSLKRLEFGVKPALSRDGRFLATFSKGLALRRSDGSGLRRLTASSFPEGEVITWSPDGKHLAFDAATSTGWSVYVINRDGPISGISGRDDIPVGHHVQIGSPSRH